MNIDYYILIFYLYFFQQKRWFKWDQLKSVIQCEEDVPSTECHEIHWNKNKAGNRYIFCYIDKFFTVK